MKDYAFLSKSDRNHKRYLLKVKNHKKRKEREKRKLWNLYAYNSGVKCWISNDGDGKSE